MIEKIKNLIEKTKNDLKGIFDLSQLNELKLRLLGKSGELTELSKGMRDVPVEDKPKMGTLLNDARKQLEGDISEVERRFEEQKLAQKLENEKIDITEPSKCEEVGALHPIPFVVDKLTDICVDLGFEVVEGPEVETDYYNFEAMNIPKNHPSRDMQDTFFIDDRVLLRSQTSAVQARVMEKIKPPFKIVCPGKTYRSESDSTHSPIFNQFEGLVVDEKISMADLKAMLLIIMKRLFGEDTEIRFRPSFFPFTEPSIEVDVSCPKCHGTGCSTCKGTGMLELLGAGIVNPKVLEINGIDSSRYSGFAFGFGVDRTAMLLDSIPNIRYLYRNDIRFLKQMR